MAVTASSEFFYYEAYHCIIANYYYQMGHYCETWENSTTTSPFITSHTFKCPTSKFVIDVVVKRMIWCRKQNTFGLLY